MELNRPSIAWYLEEFHDIVVPNGRQPKVRCPWHDDRSPSASVYRASERFKCYAGCFHARAVDVLDIVQEMHGLDFQGAVEMTKDWPGTLVEVESMKSSREERRTRHRRAPYSFKILERS